jgi:hypothetical protein
MAKQISDHRILWKQIDEQKNHLEFMQEQLYLMNKQNALMEMAMKVILNRSEDQKVEIRPEDFEFMQEKRTKITHYTDPIEDTDPVEYLLTFKLLEMPNDLPTKEDEPERNSDLVGVSADE